eukprot:gb/GEZN01002533.1/.p1 GENE.gb/GEZN01002533.1/~~gb/GEZN01002533.1/.p1  ORF type:complete len:678 (-),score=64.38 gb/GEZN01002533.1/:385-2418(-)
MCKRRSGRGDISTSIEYNDRHCTDVPFFLLFAGLFFGMIGFFGWSGAQGNPETMFDALDWNANLCGKGDLKHYKYGSWPDPYYAVDFHVCVQDCNLTTGWRDTYGFSNYNSTLLGLHWCVPDDANSLVYDTVNSNAAQDLETTWPVIFASIWIALALSWVYVWLAQRCGSLLIIIAILLSTAAAGISAWQILAAAYQMEDLPGVDQQTVFWQKFLGWFIVACAILFLLLLFAMRHLIQDALDLVKEASAAMNDMPCMMLCPFWSLVWAGGYFMMFLIMSVFLFSVGEYITTSTSTFYISSVVNTLDSNMPHFAENYYSVPQHYNNTFEKFHLDKSMRGWFALSFFQMLWVEQFTVYMTYLILAGAVAEWYFSFSTPDGEKVRGDKPNELSPRPITGSACRSFRFHMGSVAFGSMLILIIKIMRAVVEYLNSKCKERSNTFQKCMMCCIRCCMYCVEWVCNKITQNAYVWMAITGDNFVDSACSAFQLVWENLARAGAMELVNGFIFHLGWISVSAGTSFICVLIIQGVYGVDTYNSMGLPITLIVFLSIIVSHFTMSVFDVAMDTIFLCYLVDEETALQNGTPMFARQTLQDLFYRKRLSHAKRTGGRPPPRPVVAGVRTAPALGPGELAQEDFGANTQPTSSTAPVSWSGSTPSAPPVSYQKKVANDNPNAPSDFS